MEGNDDDYEELVLKTKVKIAQFPDNWRQNGKGEFVSTVAIVLLKSSALRSTFVYFCKFYLLNK